MRVSFLQFLKCHNIGKILFPQEELVAVCHPSALLHSQEEVIGLENKELQLILIQLHRVRLRSTPKSFSENISFS